MYPITGVDNSAKTVTIDGRQLLGVLPTTPWGIVWPLRTYEVFLPGPGDLFHGGPSMPSSPEEPVVFAHIGVSAADDKLYAADAPKWATGRWGGRYGNEGRVGPPANGFRVLRQAPPPPVPPPDAVRVFPTPADYHGHSFYTYHWRPSANLKTHIFKAPDDAIFKVY